MSPRSAAVGRAHTRSRSRMYGRSVCAGARGVSILELVDVQVEYLRRDGVMLRVVAGASLRADAGEIMGLVGETGCGKSSLARAAVGLVAPSRGEVRFEGQPVHPLGRRARPRRETRLQMVFQNPYGSLNPRRRIGDQIAGALAVASSSAASIRTKRVTDLLHRVGLSAEM